MSVGHACPCVSASINIPSLGPGCEHQGCSSYLPYSSQAFLLPGPKCYISLSQLISSEFNVSFQDDGIRGGLLGYT